MRDVAGALKGASDSAAEAAESSAAADAVAAAVDDLVVWARDSALPLWAEAGFDRATGGFEEQLTFDHAPVSTVPRRAMVQARQICVYAGAAQRGWYPGGATLATRAADALIRRYARDGGAAGFWYALDPAGQPLDDRFDLYAHAFVLFALAWAIRLDPKPAYRRTVDMTLDFLDSRYADRIAGGYWDHVPPLDGYRRQNPHMHMVEALLELYEATGDVVFLDRLAPLRSLCEDRFCAAPGGIVHELYDENWTVAAPLVEPGHQMEWSWLLCRHDTHLGRRSDLADHLFDHALTYGLDRQTGRVIDAITATGTRLASTSRSWPHTETAKAIVTQYERGRPGALDVLAPVLRRLRTVYARDDLKGGWVDQVDEDDQPLSAIMPASTFYHLFLAIAESDRLVRTGAFGHHAA